MLEDYYEQRAYWRENGPPLKVIVLHIASWLGFDYLPKADGEAFYGELEPGDDGPSIAELNASITPPIPGGDTLAASLEAMRLLSAPEGSS